MQKFVKLNDISNLKPQSSKFYFHNSCPYYIGSGAESTKFATIWSEETKQKFSYENENLLPEVVYLILITKSLNYDLTLTTTLDALCHAVDSLLNKNSNNESIRLSKEAIKLTNSNFSLLLENLENIDYRAEALYASNLSGRAINISRTSLNHSISYPLTNYYGLPRLSMCFFSHKHNRIF